MLYYSRKESHFLRKRFQRRLYYIYGCEISHTAKIHKSVKFVHPIAVIIGSRAIIDEECKIYQGVTIGSNFNSDGAMPHIKKNTYIGAGAKLIGSITIGENCIVGANAIVTKSIPDNTIVTGSNTIRGKK